MALKKNFLRKAPDFIRISRFKLVVGILLGLSFSFTFYSFLCFIREVFRLLSVTGTYDLWILTENEVHFYNFFYALISVLLGQSVSCLFWFDRPKGFFSRKNYRKISIVNDQRALNSFFLSWFSKLALVFGLAFGPTFHGGFYVFSFYPDYVYLFILISIVLYLQMWNTLNLMFKSKGQKWMLVSGAILTILALGMSRVNLIDYKTINKKVLQKNIHHNYKIELPETENFERLVTLSLVENIYIVKTKTQKGNDEPRIVADNKEIDVDELPSKIAEWRSLRSRHIIQNMIYRINIHKSINMAFINRVKDALSKSGVTRIAYAVIPADHEYDERFYSNYSFPMMLASRKTDAIPPLKTNDALDRNQNIIKIELNRANILIGDSVVKANEIKDVIAKLIGQNTDYVIVLDVNNRVDFSVYFKVLSDFKGAINELRNEYSEKEFSKKYELLDFKMRLEVKEKLPFRLLEKRSELKEESEKESNR